MSENRTDFFSTLPEREKKRVTLPSGRKITILETTGREEKILTRGQDRNKIPELIGEYLAGISEDLDDTTGKIDKSKFEEMLVGDRIYMLIQARVLSHGPTVTHKHKCSGCDYESEHEIDLQKILDEIKPYPNGNDREFSVEIEKNAILWFELPNGKTEAKIARNKEVEINSKLRSLRLWTKTPSGNFPVPFDDLRSRHISLLRQAVRENECYIDTIAEIECTSCGRIEKADIVGMNDFLFPNLAQR